MWWVRHFTCSFSWPVEETVGVTKGVSQLLGAGKEQCLSDPSRSLPLAGMAIRGLHFGPSSGGGVTDVLLS